MKKTILLFNLCFALILACNNLLAQNDVLYVNENSTATDPDGSSWTLAYQYLQDALDAAHSNSTIKEIRVADGTYYPDDGDNVTNDLRTESFNMRSGLSLLGGYAGDGSKPNNRNIDFYETILNGNIGALNDSTDNTLNIINCINVDNVLIDGFTIKEGVSNNGYPSPRGPALYVENSTVSINKCLITNNVGNYHSGGIYIRSDFLKITNCSFVNNVGGNAGAVLLNKDGSILISESLFESNEALNGTGAIFSVQATQSVSIPNRIDNCEFIENRGTDGGAIKMTGTIDGTDILNCVFKNNYSGNSGGGIFVYFKGNTNIVNCVFSNNTSLNSGGGVHVGLKYLSFFGELKILNSTFYNNASLTGNGIAITNKQSSESGFVNITNCILWGEDSNTEIAYEDSEDLKVTFSNVQNGFPGLGNISTNPLFVDPLQNNYQLSNGSDCLNLGNNNVDGLPQFDINGNNRINCGFVDMGAYEAQGRCDRIYVNDNASGANNGNSWTDAYRDLQDALDEAAPGSEIWVAEGNYIPSVSNSKNNHSNIIHNSELIESDPESNGRRGPSWFDFTIGKGIRLYGGFKGLINETSLDDRDWENNPTILSGDVGVPNVQTDNCLKIVAFERSLAILDGFVISESNDDSGIGIYFYYSGGTVSNCIIQNNNVGISAWYDCEVVVNNCQVMNNTTNSYNHAGGISLHASSFMKVKSSIFSDNQGRGGAIILNNSNAIIEHCIFSNNWSASLGRGFAITGGNTSVGFCTFYNDIYHNSGNSPFSTSNGKYDVSNSIIWDEVNSVTIDTDDIILTYSNISNSIYATNTNFTSDPFFVDASNRDFHLKSTERHYSFVNGWTSDPDDCSPCINAGDPSIVCVELDGSSRVNIGAYGNTQYASFGCPIIGSHSKYKADVKLNPDFINIYPNPVTNKMTIELDLEMDSFVNMYLNDISGKFLTTLINDHCKSGNNMFVFEIDKYIKANSGIYFLTIETNEKVVTERIIINR